MYLSVQRHSSACETVSQRLTPFDSDLLADDKTCVAVFNGWL